MTCTGLPRRALKRRPDSKFSETRSANLALRLLFRWAKRLGYVLIPIEVLGLPGDHS
jgi:hypothetical protein